MGSILKLLMIYAAAGGLALAQEELPRVKGETAATGQNALIPIKKNDQPTQPTVSGLPDVDAEWAIKSHLEPMLYLDVDLSRNRITNLTPHDSSAGADQPVHHEDNPEMETMVFGDYRDGFKVVSLRQVSLGLGAQRRLEVFNGGEGPVPVGAIVGLVPIGGSDAINVRHVKTMNEARTIVNQVTVPESLAALNDWTAGDSLMVASNGGILFYAGLTYHTVGVAGVYVAQGTWSIYMEKISAAEVHVKITKGVLKEYGVVTGGALASVGLSAFDNTDDSFSFRLDLDKPEAQEVFRLLIGGDLRAAQEASILPDGAARYVAMETEIQSGTFRNFIFGIPLLFNTSWSSGKIDTFARRDLVIEGRKIEAQYGLYARTRRHVGFGVRRVRQQGFYGVSYSDSGYGRSRGQFGKYIWSFADNSSNHWRVRSALREVVRQTGLKQILVNIPAKDNLEYVSFLVDIHFSQDTTHRLMRLAESLSEKEFVERGLVIHREYFRDMKDEPTAANDPLDLCSDYGWNVDHCKYSLERYTKSGMAQMWRALREMNDHREDNVKFTKAYAEFGEGISETVFALQAVVRAVGGQIPVHAEINGTHVSAMKMSFQAK